MHLEEIKTNEISQLSKRPKFAITNKTKIISAFNLKIPDWKESLMKFLKNLMKKILITGGAGFIGAHVVKHFVKKYSEYQIINLDCLTYAAEPKNLQILNL